MAVKTITIDMDAYDALKRRKRKGQSFSDVIKEHFGGAATGRDLARTLREIELADETLDAVDELIAGRSRDRATSADL